MHRAYATLELKAVDSGDGKRRFTGIASTPSTDRMGDIVEPKGAQFKLPLPLLWQHNSREPIGWVTDAKVSDSGITVTGEVSNWDKPGRLRDRLEEAWHTLEAGLVRGLSIGFSSIESADIKGTWSTHFLKWLWLELSAVTIPANAEATITSIKSADEAMRRAAFGTKSLPIVRLDPRPSLPRQADAPPGVPGNAAPTTRKRVVYLR